MLSALVICCVDECGEGGAGVGWGKWVAQVGCHFRIGFVLVLIGVCWSECQNLFSIGLNCFPCRVLM